MNNVEHLPILHLKFYLIKDMRDLPLIFGQPELYCMQCYTALYLLKQIIWQSF